ncbi:MAG: peptidylprolyl isomerase [Bacteroidetes bacterium]|nr:MAG: peptidylprolyl isomerase [Bacteroidota bacterium]TAG88756.1 MAG: peptidylprolyl isomerase [Bacteroidota bacterium]
MAVINKIRQYSWVAIFFIAFAIVAFIAADLLGPNGIGVLGAPDTSVGSINGEKVKREEFDAEVSMVSQNYQNQTGKAPDETQLVSIREQAWNNIMFRRSYTPQFEKLGIDVSQKELVAMIQGDSTFIHSFVSQQQQFQDPVTKKFDKNQVIKFLQQMPKAAPMQQYQWKNFEEAIKKDRLKNKYEDLFKNSVYVTQAEAEAQYQAQNTKAEVKYVYVPYTSIADSTLKATDEEMKAYLNKYPEKFKGQETRSLEYVAFDIKPSKKDSALLFDEIKKLAREIATTENDSLFVLNNAENPTPISFKPIKDIPLAMLEKTPVILKGGLYGPVLDGKAYKIFKIIDEKADTVASVRSSHILFKADKAASAEDKAAAEKKANDILQQIKDGADFAEMAKKHGSDGTAQTGGDLGWYQKGGNFVKDFENALFSTDKMGLMPNLVKTDFGYHIVKITYPQTKKQYKMAVIDKSLDPGEDTKNEIFRKAETFRNTVKNTEDFRNEIKKNPTLVLQKAERLNTNSTDLNDIKGAKEIIRWSFSDGNINDVSVVSEISEANKYVIATITAKSEKDKASIEGFKEQLKAEVIKEKKQAQIMKKLGEGKGTLEEIAKGYGTAALFNTVADVNMANNMVGTSGFNPVGVGKSFGLKPGKRTKPFIDESGVMIIELVKINEAAKTADYSQFRNQVADPLKQRVQYSVSEAIKEASNIDDNRHKIY